MGDRIAVMNEGRLQQVGTPQELYDQPVNRFVAGFIGSPSMNFVDVTVTGGDSGGAGGRLEAPGITIPVPTRMADAIRHAAGKPIVAGFRPEHFELGPTEEAVATVSGVAEVVEFLGNDELLHVKVADRDIVAIVASEFRVKPGDNVTLRIPLDKVYLFDPESGMAIDAQRRMAAA